MTHTDLTARLRELHTAATPGNLSSAEIIEDGDFICPHCDGNGEVDGEQYINYDGVAANVLFTGIGHEFGANRDWYIAICRDWPEISDALTSQQEQIEALEGALRPFAEIADLFDSEVEGHSDTDELSLFYGDDAEWLAERFTLAQFNAARAALQATGKGEA